MGREPIEKERDFSRSVSEISWHIPGKGYFIGPAFLLKAKPGTLRYLISRGAFLAMIREEKRRPDNMKKALCWLFPGDNPPCWHQIADISIKEHKREGKIEVILKLKECPYED